MVFKKDITPIGKKGTVTKHSGKGSAERQPQLLPRITNRYPKQTAPAPSPMMSMMRPMGSPPEDV